MAKNPSTRWYFNDWMIDPGLRACSVPARGLWIDCLAICAGAKRHGYLEIEGRACTVGDLARITGAPRANVSRWLAELEKNGVFSRDENGTIYNRRMAREGNPDPDSGTPKRTPPKRWGGSRARPRKNGPDRSPPDSDSGSEATSQDSPSCSNAESGAAREVEKPKERNPVERAARASAVNRPRPKTPALRAQIKVQLAWKHCRFLRERGHPGEALEYYNQIDPKTCLPPPALFEAVDARMRAARWDDMRAWKSMNGIAA
jgi:hypothetical protein